MTKVYQVIEGYYYSDEKHETLLGIYSTREKAQIRSEQVKKQGNVDPCSIFIKEIQLDVDIYTDPYESCICG